MMRMSSSSTLSLALREEDNGKRAGSITGPNNSSVSEAARKKGCHLFRHHSHRTRSCRSQRSDADHVEWRGWANALSLCGDGEARGHWADVSSLDTQISNLLPAVFFSQIPGRKKTGGREGLSCSLKRSVSVISVQGMPARLTMTARHLQQCCAEIWISYWIAAGDDRICKMVAARGPIQLLRCFNVRSRHQRRVNEEGSSSLKRRKLICGGDARHPSYFGGLWRAA